MRPGPAVVRGGRLQPARTQAARTGTSHASPTAMSKLDIAIIGAGAAGIAAARALHEQGIRLIVLEARERIGGRVWTHRDARTPVPIELGAEFIHGSAPE